MIVALDHELLEGFLYKKKSSQYRKKYMDYSCDFIMYT